MRKSSASKGRCGIGGHQVRGALRLFPVSLAFDRLPVGPLQQPILIHGEHARVRRDDSNGCRCSSIAVASNAGALSSHDSPAISMADKSRRPPNSHTLRPRRVPDVSPSRRDSPRSHRPERLIRAHEDLSTFRNRRIGPPRPLLSRRTTAACAHRAADRRRRSQSRPDRCGRRQPPHRRDCVGSELSECLRRGARGLV